MKRILISFLTALALASTAAPALAFKGTPPPDVCPGPWIFGYCL